MLCRKYPNLILTVCRQLINDQVISQELPDLVKEIETTLAQSQIVIPSRPNSAIQRQNTGSSRRSSRAGSRQGSARGSR